MIPLNARSTERDNQNSLRKYPFSDAASCTNGACVLPPGAVIDAQLYVPGREPGRVWLSQIDTDGRLRFSDAAGEFAKTVAPAAPDSAVPVTFTGDGGPCPGGVVVFGKAVAVSALASLGGQRFTADQAELAPAAVSWPGLPGVLGFRLDDGHVVYGDVKIRGENGCVVSTYVEENIPRLRISAVGGTVESVETARFITKVVAESDNVNFVVSKRTHASEGEFRVVDLQMTGVSTLMDDMANADQDNLCGQVRQKTGAGPSERAVSSLQCEDDVCAAPGVPRRIWLHDYQGQLVTWTDDPEDSYIPVTTGGELGTLQSNQVPAPPEGWRFAGYYDAASRPANGKWTLYYRHDRTGARRFTLDADIDLYAQKIRGSSRAEITFDGYGTLHLAAPNVNGYANPLRISGLQSPVPSVRERTDAELEAGGAEALAEIVLHPAVPPGEVHIELRGSDKATLL